MTDPDPQGAARPAPVRPRPADSSPATPPTAGGPAKVTAATASYVTRPTRWTVFLRTFVPWQLWRFARINLKMIRIIWRSRP